MPRLPCERSSQDRLGMIYRTISSSNCHQSRSILTYQSIPKHWTSVLARRLQSLQPVTTLLHIPRYVKPSSSCNDPMHKKRKHHLQQRSTRQHRPHSKPHRRSPKSHSPLDQGSTVTAVSRTEGRLPSPAPSAPHATDTDMSPDCCNLDRLSALPTLTEVTIRTPHTAAPSLQWSGTEADRDHVDATRIRPREGTTVDAGTLASRRSKPKPSISDDDGSEQQQFRV